VIDAMAGSLADGTPREGLDRLPPVRELDERLRASGRD
jgi:hypothetical protein